MDLASITRRYEQHIADNAVRHVNQLVALELQLEKTTTERNNMVAQVAQLQARINELEASRGPLQPK